MRVRNFRTGLIGVALAAGCAQIAGLDEDYHLRPAATAGRGGDGASPGGEAGENSQGGSAGNQGGTTGQTGGEGGSPSGGSSPGTGGRRPTGGSGGTGAATGGSGATTGGTGTATGGGGTGGDAGGGGDAGTGGGSTRPSCSGLPRECGLRADVDCCRSTTIPGGPFDLSNDFHYPARVSDFELDVFEVSVGRFRKFAEAFAAGYRPPEGAGKNVNNASDPGWNPSWNALLPVDGDALVGRDGVQCVDENWPEDFWTYTDEPGEGDSRPMNCLDWYLAYAFCIWDDARLPTEAEWNYAAAGGGEQRLFPWSDPPELDTIGETYASYYVDVTRECGGDGTDGCAPTDLVRVGSKKDGYSRWRQADLGGNVWEWVQDLYALYGDDCNDCANLDSGTNRIGRGGGYVSYWGLLRTESRVDFDPRYRSSAFGVRCARNVP